MLYIPTQELKFRKMPLYIILAILFFFGYILVDTDKIDDTVSLMAGVVFLLLFFLFYFLSKLKFMIDNEGITHDKFFGKPKELQWTDIKSSELTWHYHGHGASLSWEFISFSGKSLSFNPSYYSRKHLRPLAEALVLKCHEAVIDKRIVNMAKGKFPWYLF